MLRTALSNVAYTENGAVSHASTGNALLDFFAHAAALRAGGVDQIARVVPMFEAAFAEDPITAIVAAFYLRDIRGGQREREAFRQIINWLATNQPSFVIPVLHLIPEYGRWDDLVIFGPHQLIGKNIVEIVKHQLSDDRYSKKVSLLAKYMPSENASSQGTKELAEFWMQKLGFLTRIRQNQRGYRQLLSKLRARIGIVETLMSKGLWNKIDYSKVPSQAMRIYRKAFAKHDPERFAAYIAAVKAGDEKINAGTLFPYEIIRQVTGAQHDAQEMAVLQALWDAQPNYFDDAEIKNLLVVVDTSGSMAGLPLLVSTSLGIYAAEHMEGYFADTVIEFSEKPSFKTIPREWSLLKRLQAIEGSGLNTNFQAVFDTVLDSAVRNSVPQEQMPGAIAVISDLQFDEADGSVHYMYNGNKPLNAPTNFELVRQKYAAAGYKMPLFIMWNVRAASDQPVQMKEPGVYLVSGCSPIIFRNALRLDTATITPMDAMMQTLNDARYNAVQKALGA